VTVASETRGGPQGDKRFSEQIATGIGPVSADPGLGLQAASNSQTRTSTVTSMRDFKGMKRQRGRNRKPSGGNNVNATNPNRSWDSQGPENIKVRGNAQTVYERYMQLARDAGAAGDRVLAENYTQHAEHYFRVLRALQPLRSVSEIAQRELAGQGFDIDFEDESGAQAAAIIAAQQAEERRAEDEARRQADRAERDAQRERERLERMERGERSDRQERPERAERTDRPERAERTERSETDVDGEVREGGRRETRRERWERRREEQRNRRYENDGTEEQPREGVEAVEAEAASDQVDAAPVEVAAEAEAAPRAPRGRRPRAAQADAVEAVEGEDISRDANSLPGFVTRPVVIEETAEEAPAPRRRAPRRKVESEES